MLLYVLMFCSTMKLQTKRGKIMGFLDFFKKKKTDSVQGAGDLVDKVKDLAQNNTDEINNVVDKIQEAIPGTAGDSVIDAAQEKLTGEKQ